MERNRNFKHYWWEYKWFSCYRKQFGSFSKMLHRMTIQPSNSTSRYIPPENRDSNTYASTFTAVLFTTMKRQKNSNVHQWWMDKQIVAYPYRRIYYSVIKWLIHATTWMNLKNTLSEKARHRRSHNVQHLHMIHPESWRDRDSTEGAARSSGRREQGVTAYIYLGFSFEVIECFGIRERWLLHNTLNVINATELFIFKWFLFVVGVMWVSSH